MPDLDITWVSRFDKQRCIDGLLLILSWAIERKAKINEEVISFPPEVRRRLVLHKKTLNERGLKNGPVQESRA
jgi:hypothetical protein